MEIVTTIAPIALALIMLGLGLGLTSEDFTRVITHPKDFYYWSNLPDDFIAYNSFYSYKNI